LRPAVWSVAYVATFAVCLWLASQRGGHPAVVVFPIGVAWSIPSLGVDVVAMAWDRRWSVRRVNLAVAKAALSGLLLVATVVVAWRP
jgi:hypothetical protein